MAIEGITADGGVQTVRVGGMDAELVSAPGQGNEFHECLVFVCAEGAVSGLGFFAVGVVNGLSRAVSVVRTHGEGDSAFRFAQSAVKQRDVAFLHATFAELPMEGRLDVRRFGKEKNARCGHVEAVDGI